MQPDRHQPRRPHRATPAGKVEAQGAFDDVLRALLDAADEDYACYLRLAAVTGARRGQLVALDAVGPYLRRLADPEPLVYNAAEAAHLLATSTKTVRRLVDEGVLPVVPHLGHRVVIPRSAVMRLVDGAVEASGSEAEPVTPATSQPTREGALHVA